jgi:hypothetical protein
MLKKLVCFVSAIGLITSSISCATIVSGRHQDLPVISSPSGATITIGGIKQASPATFTLDRRQSVYVVKVEMEGYEPVEMILKKGVNGWVFGNLLFGGIIGLVIDLSTGSASKFKPDEVSVNLAKTQVGLNNLEGKDLLFVKLVHK